jgi:hypothetical protein
LAAAAAAVGMAQEVVLAAAVAVVERVVIILLLGLAVDQVKLHTEPLLPQRLQITHPVLEPVAPEEIGVLQA